jgi:hypothetical protein
MREVDGHAEIGVFDPDRAEYEVLTTHIVAVRPQ